MTWGRRFALFNPKLPFFLGKRRREPQPQEELAPPASSKRTKWPQNLKQQEATPPKTSSLFFAGFTARKQSAWFGEGNGWKSRRGEKTRRLESDDVERTSARVEEPHRVKWLGGLEDTGAGIGLQRGEASSGIRPESVLERNYELLEKRDEGSVEGGRNSTTKNGSFSFVNLEDVARWKPIQTETPARRLVQHDYEHLMKIFKPDDRAGQDQNQDLAEPMLGHHPGQVPDESHKQDKPSDILKTVQKTPTNSQPSNNGKSLEVVSPGPISAPKHQMLVSSKKRSLLDLDQPGPETEKYRPGRRKKEQRTINRSPSQMQGIQSDNAANPSCGSIEGGRRHISQWFMNGACPSIYAVCTQESRPSHRPRQSETPIRKPNRTVQTSVRQLTGPYGNSSTWKPDEGLTGMDQMRTKLRSMYAMTIKTSEKKIEEALKLRDKIRQDAQNKAYPSLEELDNQQTGVSGRCSKLQQSPPLSSLLRWRSIPPPDEVESSVSGITNEEIVEEQSLPAAEGPPETIVESKPPAARTAGVKAKGEDCPLPQPVSSYRDGRVLTQIDNVEFTSRILACLNQGEWLNDEVMNGYMRLLQERDARYRETGLGYPKCHFHKTFFMNRLLLDSGKYCYKNVQRWTKPQKLKNWGQQSQSILDCDIVFFPIHLSVHWVLAAAFLKEKKIVYYDSLKQKPNKKTSDNQWQSSIIKAIADYLVDEAKDKKGEEGAAADWTLEFAYDIPRQTNGCDCGVFALQYAKALSKLKWDGNWGFSQAHMRDIRVKMLKEFMSKQIS